MNPETYPQKVGVSHLNNHLHRQRAIKWAFTQPIGIRFLQNGVLAVSNNQEEILGRMCQVKGERKGPFGIIIPKLDFIYQTIDTKRIPEGFIQTFPLEQMQGLCFFRYPITEESAQKLNPELISRDDQGLPSVQVLYFGNNQPTTQRFISEIDQKFRQPICVSSMNTHGQPTPVTPKEALQFLNNPPNHPKVPIHIIDKLPPLYKVRSFPIISIDSKGATLSRVGNTRPDDLQALFPELITNNPTPENPNRIALVRHLCDHAPQFANLFLRSELLSPIKQP